MKKYPTTRYGWYCFYAKYFNKKSVENNSPRQKEIEHLALYFWLLHIAFGEKNVT